MDPLTRVDHEQRKWSNEVAERWLRLHPLRDGERHKARMATPMASIDILRKRLGDLSRFRRSTVAAVPALPAKRLARRASPHV
ncbi:MAG: hypothetical protein U1F26_18710 [Lysobacterales bacterium]